MVGTTISHRTSLGVQGNFSPAFADPLKTMKAAKLQFEIARPVLDLDFGPDYNVNYDNFLDLQDKIMKTPLRRFFLIEDGRTMRFNYLLCKPKTDNNNMRYNINADCTPWFDLVKQSHQLCCVPLYNANKNLDTKPKTWESKLIGAMVEVTFSLKHYPMAANSQCVKASDTFSIKVESISILRPLPPILYSLFKNLASPEKPSCTPQTLSHGQ
ncbi:hypothetical protein CVT25_012515 [Psilocybe cyanescens]|uniref:Uncharacterized protein n=1 Tax=Psilocybe cyanescens TaxID=93625 RepID=A0A409X4D1_PSICY|nr:hypothetical protein CVT25_012515 [Psilocybe cyanescens]